MGVNNNVTKVGVNWSSATNLHGDSAGEDVNNILGASSSGSMDAKALTQNITELELNFQQAHANKNASGQTDISDSQYTRLESELQNVIKTANSAIAEQSGSSGTTSSTYSAYTLAIDALISDMQGEFLETSNSTYSSFSGGTNGYLTRGAINMAAIYTPPTAEAKSAASNASAEPVGMSGASAWETPSSFSLFPSGTPSPDDVNQGGVLNDCYFDSSLISLASTSSGVSAIQNNISAIAGSNPPAFSVTMYAPDGEPVHIAVDDTVPAGTSSLSGSDSTAVTLGKDNQANWATLMEKAFAKYVDMYPEAVVTDEADVGKKHGYDLLNQTSNPIGAMMALTGQSTATMPLSPSASSSEQTQTLANMQEQIDAGGLMTAITPANTDGSESSMVTDADGTQKPIYAAHAYTVLSAKDGKVELRNPWGGKDATITLSAEDYFKHFVEFEYSMPGTSVKGAQSQDDSSTSTPSTSSDSSSTTPSASSSSDEDDTTT